MAGDRVTASYGMRKRASPLACVVVSSATLLANALVAACGGFLPTPDLSQASPTGPRIEIDENASVDVANGTTLVVTVVVNGAPIQVVAAGTSATVKAAVLGPKPWHVEARTASGRVLLRFAVQPGQITRIEAGTGATRLTGAGARRDLSCGRLDVTVGPPMLGPAPGPGEPGDCVP